MTDYVNIYFHNWDFADLESETDIKLPGFFTKNSGENFLKYLNCFIIWNKEKNVEVSTIFNYLLLLDNEI